MDVELADNIAQSAGIDLVAVGRLLERLRDNRGFKSQHCLIEWRHIVNFGKFRTARHEDHPGPSLVIHQPQFAQAKLGD
ncbi:hypothetical protein D9M69_718620 [compost metagenome]